MPNSTQGSSALPHDPRGVAKSTYPDDNPKTIYGINKPSISAIPPVAILILGQAMEVGRAKYGLFNWRDADVSVSTYYNAAQRHLMAYLDGQNRDPETNVHHLGHAMACLAIILDANVQDTLKDDRGTKGRAADWIKNYTIRQGGDEGDEEEHDEFEPDEEEPSPKPPTPVGIQDALAIAGATTSADTLERMQASLRLIYNILSKEYGL